MSMLGTSGGDVRCNSSYVVEMPDVIQVMFGLVEMSVAAYELNLIFTE